MNNISKGCSNKSVTPAQLQGGGIHSGAQTWSKWESPVMTVTVRAERSPKLFGGTNIAYRRREMACESVVVDEVRGGGW
jgi:hypothetical protein